MSNPDVETVIFSSRYKYFLNKDIQTGSVVLTTQSIPTGQTRTYSLSIPIENEQAFSQIKINFSHDANDYYVYPVRAVTLDANCRIEVVGGYDSDSLDLTFFVVNQTAGTVNSTETTATVTAYLFETPE